LSDGGREGKVAEEKYYKHDGVERFTHWTHMLDTILLVLSGLQIHYPDFRIFGTMQTARFVHIVSGYYFIFLGIFHVYFFFALGKRKIAMPHFEDLAELGPITRYYLFLSRRKPDYAKYNVLQKFAYAALFVVSFVQAVLGFALYWPASFSLVIALFGGAVSARIWHTTIMWVFLSFTAVHAYLVLTEDPGLARAMIDGYYVRRAPGEPR
jgi:Ni/Fe-hydrogenase 1 B-type cytochrome subunit